MWGVAERTRKATDDTHGVEAFNNGEDMIKYLTDVDFAHNRAAGLAYVRFFNSAAEGSTRKKKESISIAKALNHVLTTIMLDHLAPNAGIDMDAYAAWVEQEPDETLMLQELPEGPSEPKLSESQIQKVLDLLGPLEIHAQAAA